MSFGKRFFGLDFGFCRATSFLSLVFLCAMLVACSSKPTPEMPKPEVGVVTAVPHRIADTIELSGRLASERTAQVRARIDGVVLKRVFQEGSEIKAGDLLFQIDPAPFKASFEQAQATVAKTEAAFAQADAMAKRYTTLVASKAVSQQEYENAVMAQKSAQADLASSRAALDIARINLAYTRVTAPISGHIGKAFVTEGALVRQSEATQLANIDQLDPIYFDFSQSTEDLMRLRRAVESQTYKGLAVNQIKAKLLMSDGTIYPTSGKLLFSNLVVDPQTSTVQLRAEFKNPQKWLLPGMYARVRLEEAVNENAITIPQQALLRAPDGATTVMIVDKDDKVVSRTVKVGQAVQNEWLIKQGVQAGDRVIVDGFQRIKPGASVHVVPAQPVIAD